MIQLIAPEFHEQFRDALADMYRLRARVFKDRLDWAVALTGDQEIDAFDSCRPYYLLQYSGDRLTGSVRFLPTTGPTMLADTFAGLLAGGPAPTDSAIWESSRFALDLSPMDSRCPGGLSRATFELFAGMIEFGLAQHLSRIVTVTDARLERILRRAGWPLGRLGAPKPLGNTTALAGFLDVRKDDLARVCELGGLRRPVLWEPAIGPGI